MPFNSGYSIEKFKNIDLTPIHMPLYESVQEYEALHYVDNILHLVHGIPNFIGTYLFKPKEWGQAHLKLRKSCLDVACQLASPSADTSLDEEVEKTMQIEDDVDCLNKLATELKRDSSAKRGLITSLITFYGNFTDSDVTFTYEEAVRDIFGDEENYRTALQPIIKAERVDLSTSDSNVQLVYQEILDAREQVREEEIYRIFNGELPPRAHSDMYSNDPSSNVSANFAELEAQNPLAAALTKMVLDARADSRKEVIAAISTQVLDYKHRRNVRSSMAEIGQSVGESLGYDKTQIKQLQDAVRLYNYPTEKVPHKPIGIILDILDILDIIDRD